MLTLLQRVQFACVVSFCLGAFPSLTHGALLFSVNMDTSTLVANIAEPFYIEFQLNDGSGTDYGNNTVNIVDFDFGGGSASGPATTMGGASGDLSTGVTITDNDFFNQFYQSFTPGNTLSFDVSLTTNLDAGGVPDQFSFAILYTDSFYGRIEIPTGGGGPFLGVDIDSAIPPINAYASDPTQAPFVYVPEPVVQSTQAVIPEPSTLTIFAGLTAVGWLRCFRRRRTPTR